MQIENLSQHREKVKVIIISRKKLSKKQTNTKSFRISQDVIVHK